MSDNKSGQTHTLDTSGLSCPEPVMLLHSVVRDALPGDTIIVLATDPATKRDIAKFCNYLGHVLVNTDHNEDLLTYEIVKGEG